MHNRTQYSLSRLFVVIAIACVICGIIRITGRYSIGLHLAFCLAGWLLSRLGHAHLGGLIPALVGADFLAVITIDWVYFCNPEDWLGGRSLVVALATLLTFVGSIVFAIVGAKQKVHWKTQLAFAFATFVALLAWHIMVPPIGGANVSRVRKADAAANSTAALKAVRLVDKVCLQLGRIPDAAEMNNLLPEPLPLVRHFNQEAERIRYRRLRNGSYELSYPAYSWDMFIYSSSESQKGWQRIPF